MITGKLCLKEQSEFSRKDVFVVRKGKAIKIQNFLKNNVGCDVKADL